MRAAHIGIKSVRGHKSVRRKLLEAASVDGLAGVEIANGVGRDHMEQSELTGSMPSTTETAEYLARLMVENPQNLIACIDDVHVLLLRVWGKRDIQRRSDSPATRRTVRRRRIGRSGFHVDGLFDGSHLVEDFDPVVAAVADI